MNDRGGLARQTGLIAVVFVATLALIIGAATILGRSGARDTAAGSLVPSGPAVVGPSVSLSEGSPGSGASASPLASGPESPFPSGAAESPVASGPATVTITGAGDIAQCGVDGAKKTSDLLINQPGWIFTVGDNAYETGSAANYANCYAPTWGRVLNRTILPAVGNHDWLTPGAAGYHDYFGTKAEPNGTTYYSMDLGAWHIVVLESDCSKVGGCKPNSPQGKWLAADLAASTAQCTLAIWHHPRFSSGEHGDQQNVAPFWDALYQAGAELVINGHDHDYERFAPQDPQGNEARPNGIREIVVGTGGADLRGFNKVVPNSELRVAREWGVLRLTLEPTKYDWEFLPVSGGQVSDSGSTPCH